MNHLRVLDSLGLPIPIGLGLALGLADDPRYDKVVVVEGDGSLIFGFSVLTTIGLLKPKKLLVVILDQRRLPGDWRPAHRRASN
jgi:thiamine pyrophosphate-dependent acetolactate synthase large subunit-like protein